MRVRRVYERIRPPKLAVLLEDVPPEAVATAKKWQENFPKPQVKVAAIPFTEDRLELVLLRMIASSGQIEPHRLRRMRTLDLEYLAGIPPPPRQPTWLGSFVADQDMKVAENAHRAARELERRAIFRAQLVGTGLATIGATIGATILQGMIG